MYTVFNEIITNRIANTVDTLHNQHLAEFKGFRTIIRKIMSRTKKHQLPLILRFVEFNEAFHIVYKRAVTEALAR